MIEALLYVLGALVVYGIALVALPPRAAMMLRSAVASDWLAVITGAIVIWVMVKL